MDTFWKLCPTQFNKYLKVYNQKQKEDLEIKDTLNYLLGKYIAFAFNDVKHYPKKPFLAEEKKEQVKHMTIEDMERIAKQNVIKLGGAIN